MYISYIHICTMYIHIIDRLFLSLAVLQAELIAVFLRRGQANQGQEKETHLMDGKKENRKQFLQLAGFRSTSFSDWLLKYKFSQCFLKRINVEDHIIISDM